VGFVENKVALEQVCLRVHLFSSVTIIPPDFHTYLNRQVSLTRWENVLSPENFKPAKLFTFLPKSEAFGRKVLSLFVVFKNINP